LDVSYCEILKATICDLSCNQTNEDHKLQLLEFHCPKRPKNCYSRIFLGVKHKHFPHGGRMDWYRTVILYNLTTTLPGAGINGSTARPGPFIFGRVHSGSECMARDQG